ncbi:hypothetical protein TNCV_3758781 [Trichonephila clavipes]|nr:hypothetical protein TNCV_3758781 [Trichonephila clavipes]
MQYEIRPFIETFKSRMVFYDILFYSFCKRASNSTKFLGCPTCRSRLSQICSIGNNSKDEAGQRRVEIWRKHSPVKLSLCGPAISC